jgi:type II secretory pathway pseudopilin PulG
MRKKTAFTLLELVFSIVILGIIGKFGVEFLSQVYRSFIFTNVNHSLEASSASTVELIASRLQYRIKDSVIAREENATDDPIAIDSASGDDYKVLEWVGYDTDGFKGDWNGSFFKPNWSSILDLDAGDANHLVSPETNTTAIDNLVQTLSDGNSSIDDIALYFPGSDSDIQTGYGWDGNLTLVNDQNGTMHPVTSVSGHIDEFNTSTGTNFSGVDIYEYYQLAWTAYAVVLTDYNATGNDTGTLKLYYNYQPWKGENFDSDGTLSTILMKNVSTFQFIALGSILKIQVCVKSDLVEEYSICKEKTVF